MAGFKGTITNSDPSDIHFVRLRANAQYIIDLKGDGRNSLRDPALVLVGENGEYAEDDNGGPGKRAQIAFSPAKTQFFDVTILGENGSSGDYRLEINVDDFRNGVLGEAPAGALTTSGSRRDGIVNYSNDADIFSISLIDGLTYGIRATPKKSGDEVNPDIALLGADGRPLARDEDSGPGEAAFLPYLARETGDYWIRVAASGDGTGGYSLRAGVGRGSQLRDVIAGSDRGDWINVLGGDDAVRSGLGSDRVWGASGGDMLDGGEDSDSLYGGSGRDELWGGLGGDSVFGGGGKDAMDGGEGGDRLDGEDGGDRLVGDLGGDNLSGGLGRDRLDGGEGGDNLYGGDGDDIARGGAGRDYLADELGNDRLYGGESGDSLYGGEGNDRIVGGLGDDDIGDEAGDNILRGGDGNDSIYAGSGLDDIAGGLSRDFLTGGDGADSIRAGEGDDYLSGGDDVDRLFGGIGADDIFGEEGDDVIFGGRDGDGIYGGGGMDAFVFLGRGDTIVERPDRLWDFDRPGESDGDIIDVSAIDADGSTPPDEAFRFDGGRERGSIWVENRQGKNQTATLVFINNRGDDEPDAMIRIEDGASVTARDYTAQDFVL